MCVALIQCVDAVYTYTATILVRLAKANGAISLMLQFDKLL